MATLFKLFPFVLILINCNCKAIPLVFSKTTQTVSPKQKVTAELAELYSKKSFADGKRFFHYANYPYQFKFLNEVEKKQYKITNPNEILVCACLSYDLDDPYQIVYNINKQGYYVINGHANLNGPERLKRPIRIAGSLAELFQCENYAEKLVEKSDKSYTDFMETSFNGYEVSKDPLPTSMFPQEDLRFVYQRSYPTGYFTDHKEYNPKRITEFIERVNLNKFINVDTFFETKPHANNFLEVLRAANKEAKEIKFLFVEFHPSGFQGIVYINDMDDETLALFLKYGLFHNKADVPDRIYKKLE